MDVLPTMPHPVEPHNDAVRTATLLWTQHVSEYRSDHAGLALLSSLKAPYGFLQQAMANLEHRLLILLCGQKTSLSPFFILQPRGSVITETALRGAADLDVDLILGRDLPEWRLDGDIANMSNADLWNWFHPMTIRLREAILRSDDGKVAFSSKKVEITRSLELQMIDKGDEIDVDLFPKILDREGNVWGPLGDKDDNGYRKWTSVPFSNPWVQTDSWNDEQRLAALLVKLWKAKRKQQYRNEEKEFTTLEEKEPAIESQRLSDNP